MRCHSTLAKGPMRTRWVIEITPLGPKLDKVDERPQDKR